ncbi:MAG: YqaA family protein [Gammaproteobacteria bacterium]|nr:YqaA family protein [Gammaproteobacteria bacterium]
MDYFTELGYLGLFLASFLAATVLPLSSEVVLSVLLLNDFNPALLITVATVGNVLGAFTNYAIGFWGSKAFVQKVLKIPEKDFIKAEERFKKYGLMSLFFAWVPLIGDALTVIAGVLRINILWFFILVASGKLIRYVVVSYLIIY